MTQSTQTLPRAVEVRRTLHSATAFVRGVEMNRQSSATTLDQLLQEHITRLGTADARFSVRGKIDLLEESLLGVIEAIESAGDDPQQLASLGVFSRDSS